MLFLLALVSRSVLREEEEKKETERNQTISGECCECPKTEKQKKVEERERNLDIQFQDYLQNAIYVKRYCFLFWIRFLSLFWFFGHLFVY